jgi:hypothetical protein
MGGGGENGAYQKALNWRTSVVQGHWHTTSYIRYNVSAVDRIFAMQVGCGIDRKAYAMAYTRNFIKRPIISCGVVQNNGTLPILCPMHL